MKLALGWLVVLASAATAAKPLETWYEFKFHGKKVGFLHSIDESTNVDGRPALHAHRRSVISVRRSTDLIQIEATTDAWAEPDGKPIRFTHVRTESGSSRRIEGTREKDQLVVRFDVGGALTEKRHPLTAGTYLSSTLDAVFKRDLKVGKKLTGQAVIEEDGDLKPFTASVVGKEGDAFVVESELAGVKSRELVLADGRTTRTKVERIGAEFVAVDREQAISISDPADIFGAARLNTKVRLPPTDTIDRLKVRLKGRSGRAPAPKLDDRQKSGTRAADSVELTIAAVEPPMKAPALPIKDAKVSRFLSETPYEALSDERLRVASKKAVGDTKDAWEAARRINAFVHRHMKEKSLTQAFATANEALEKGEGDCTEHSVLFSALAKIAGIPTRLVTGLVYVGGADGVFGYHEWVEVWMAGRWIPMDPTFGQDLADPTHVKFTEGLSDGDGLREAGVAAAELFGDLDLAVLEYEVDGRWQKP